MSKLVASEIRENLRLNETATVQECAAARNAYVQKKLTEDFFTGIDANLRPVNRAQGSKVTFEFPVFTVSSVDWQKLAGIIQLLPQSILAQVAFVHATDS